MCYVQSYIMFICVNNGVYNKLTIKTNMKPVVAVEEKS